MSCLQMLDEYEPGDNHVNREEAQAIMNSLYSPIRNKCAGLEYTEEVTISLSVREWEAILIALEIAGEL